MAPGYVDTQDLNARITKLRAEGSEGALELATELEQQAEKDAPAKLGVDPDAERPQFTTAEGSTVVEGTPVETPEAPPLPEDPQVAETPPTAEQRLADNAEIRQQTQAGATQPPDTGPPTSEPQVGG